MTMIMEKHQKSVLTLLIFVLAFLFQGCSKPPKESPGEEKQRHDYVNGHASSEYMAVVNRHPASIINLLKNEDFPELNRKVDEANEAFMNDVANEDELFFMLDFIQESREDLEAQIEHWKTAYPNDYQPFLISGVYLERKAHNARGTKWAKDTPRERFNSMDSILQYADRDLNQALLLNKNLAVAYPYLMAIDNLSTSASLAQIEKFYTKAEALRPYSLRVQEIWLATLEPRWHGNYELMQSALDTINRNAVYNPRLRVLRRTIDLDMADMELYADDGDINKAKAIIDKPENNIEYAPLYANRSYIQRKSGDLIGSLDSINKAIALHPTVYYYYETKAYIEYYLEYKGRR